MVNLFCQQLLEHGGSSDDVYLNILKQGW